MGRTPKPPTSRSSPLHPCNGWDEFKALSEQGHDIVTFPDVNDLETCGLIIGEPCCSIASIYRMRSKPQEKRNMAILTMSDWAGNRVDKIDVTTDEKPIILDDAKHRPLVRPVGFQPPTKKESA